MPDIHTPPVTLVFNVQTWAGSSVIQPVKSLALHSLLKPKQPCFQTCSLLVSAHLSPSRSLEEGHLASGSQTRKLLLGKNVLQMTSAPRINYKGSTENCHGTALGTLVLQKCLTAHNQKNKLDLFSVSQLGCSPPSALLTNTLFILQKRVPFAEKSPQTS